eukprot:TRINITY_DN12026_c0_g2_i1.p1 TRINITY_DN12026_c0_g2~~TRINITY_DN12026_c0_g2_i1.p1  ORF type:complete len:1070 (+),score=263.32 TRINITY_DN12026_c0_g2_i1:28-3237(+)
MLQSNMLLPSFSRVTFQSGAHLRSALFLCVRRRSTKANEEPHTQAPALKRYSTQTEHLGKALIVTDTHLKQSTLSPFQELVDACLPVVKRKDIHRLFILGDIFDKYPYTVSHYNFLVRQLATLTRDVDVHLLLGNHDMSTDNVRYANVREHNLASLAFIPRVHIWDEPGMVFPHVGVVPYLHDHNHVAQCIDALRMQGAKLFLAHAGFSGAEFHEGAYSRGEVSPLDIVPSNDRSKPGNNRLRRLSSEERAEALAQGQSIIVTGHYHMPQDLAIGKQLITYPGSPYEQNFSEAGQSKRMLIYDADAHVLEDVGLNIGRKHYDVTSLAEYRELEPRLQPHDRVRCSVDNETFADIRTASAKAKVQLQHRLQRTIAPRVQALPEQDLSTVTAMELVKTYCKDNEVDEEIAQQLMDELDAVKVEYDGAYGPMFHEWGLAEGNFRRVVFEELELNDYMSFEGTHRFDFGALQGLVAISGDNQLDAGHASNGTGKTTLAQAVFRCLDAKAMKTNFVSHTAEARGSKSGSVAIQCRIGDVKVKLKQSRVKGKRTVTLWVNGQQIKGSITEKDKIIASLFRTSDLFLLFNVQPTISQLTNSFEKVANELLSDAPALKEIDAVTVILKDKAKDVKDQLTKIELDMAHRNGRIEAHTSAIGAEPSSQADVLVQLNSRLAKMQDHIQYKMRARKQEVAALGQQAAAAVHDSHAALLQSHKLRHHWEHMYTRAFSNGRSVKTAVKEALDPMELVITQCRMPGSMIEEPADELDADIQAAEVQRHHQLRRRWLRQDEVTFEHHREWQQRSAQSAAISAAVDVDDHYHAIADRLAGVRMQLSDESSVSDDTLTEITTELSQLRSEAVAVADDVLVTFFDTCEHWCALHALLSGADTFTDERRKLESKAAQLADMLRVLDRTGVRRMVLDQFVARVDEYVNATPSMGNVSILIKSTTARKSKTSKAQEEIAKCELVYHKNGKEVTQLSGGELRRVQMRLQTAMQQAGRQLLGLDCNLTVFDETLDTNVDAKGTLELAELTKNYVPTKIALVTCQLGSPIEERADHVVVVVKDARGSSVTGWPS